MLPSRKVSLIRYRHPAPDLRIFLWIDSGCGSAGAQGAFTGGFVVFSEIALPRTASRLSCRFCGRCSPPPACAAECNSSVSPHTAYSAHGFRRRIATGCAAAGAVAWRAASVGPLCALFGFPQSDVTKLHAERYRNLTIFDFCFLHSTVKIVYNGEKSQSHITWTFQK